MRCELGGKEGRLEAATICDLYLFDQGSLAFIREKSLGIVELCGNCGGVIEKIEQWALYKTGKMSTEYFTGAPNSNCVFFCYGSSVFLAEN